MVLKSPYTEGKIVTLYRDPETEKEKLGTARLRKYRSTGLPIIFNEAKNELDQRTYVLEEWFVDWIDVSYKLISTIPWLYREDRPYKIMRLHKIGI